MPIRNSARFSGSPSRLPSHTQKDIAALWRRFERVCAGLAIPPRKVTVPGLLRQNRRLPRCVQSRRGSRQRRPAKQPSTVPASVQNTSPKPSDDPPDELRAVNLCASGNVHRIPEMSMRSARWRRWKSAPRRPCGRRPGAQLPFSTIEASSHRGGSAQVQPGAFRAPRIFSAGIDF